MREQSKPQQQLGSAVYRGLETKPVSYPYQRPDSINVNYAPGLPQPVKKDDRNQKPQKPTEKAS